MAESDESATTIVIRRPTRVKTDGRGRTVWVGPIEDTELDLMSSQDLKLALQAADDVDRESIRAVAASGKNGIVARDRATGLYDVISEAELRDLMDANTELSASIRRLEMVPDSEDATENPDDNPGFDPYNKT